ncbi:ATP-binding protein [Candidatus Pacearchaeota archaeon]|nr:ATP-binding protein [Candidatus Pacearchaeota archaeon]
MIDKETLRRVVKLQREEILLFDPGIEREDVTKLKLDVPFALILSGIRRCGKSTLLRQLMKKVKGFYYFNFEDSRIGNFEIRDFEKLDQIFIEEYGQQNYYFFDEIQNISQWEIFVRRLVDLKKHVIITGSNASLLSKELGTKLTGRHLTHEIFPFSFREFLKIKKENPSKEQFEEYLINGGFAEYLKLKIPDILQELLKDILARDITLRYKIRNQKTLRELAIYLLTNIGKQFTYNSLKKNFNLGSINSVISFISYFEDTYMLFTISKFDYSMKKMLVNPKKVYSIDNGFTLKNSASFFDDRGRLLENIVFINLRKNYKDIFYFQENNECDFIIREESRITQAMQVCYEINENSRDREINGLIEAMDKFKLKEGLILTYNQYDEFIIKDKKIKVLPVWKWLLEKDIDK